MNKLGPILAGASFCLALAIVLVAPATAQTPKVLLPRMVVPDASLARLSGLPQKFAFFATAADAAASTSDPSDTGADLRRLGRIAGYVRGRNAAGAFEARAPKGLLTVGTSVILWRDARSAAASIRRDIADDKRFRGKTVGGAKLVSFALTRVPSLGIGAALLHIHVRPTGGTDRFVTSVVFLVGSLRGNAIVGRGGNRSADATALQLAKQLRSRMLAVLRTG
jgi:GNAT superfamily N-acetyltransferase